MSLVRAGNAPVSRWPSPSGCSMPSARWSGCWPRRASGFHEQPVPRHGLLEHGPAAAALRLVGVAAHGPRAEWVGLLAGTPLACLLDRRRVDHPSNSGEANESQQPSRTRRPAQGLLALASRHRPARHGHRRRIFPAQRAPSPLLRCAAFAVDAGLSTDAWLHWSTPKRWMTALTVSGTAACARRLTFTRGQGSFL